MPKKTLNNLKDLKGKRVLIRFDFNVPLDKNGDITNDRRIRLTVPTIQYVLEAGGNVIAMSHLGRPKGDPAKDAIFKMDKVADRLSDLLKLRVKKLDEVVGSNVATACRQMAPGDVVLLENLRFHPGEKKGDQDFAEQLGRLADVYVNDAFGTCHRKDASMYAVPKAMPKQPRVVGFLVAKELEVLDQLLADPPRPFVSILGGGKVSDKIGFIKSLLQRVDRMLIGGAMSYTLMRAGGKGVGKSLVEGDKLDVARELLKLGKDKIMLPTDHLIVEDLAKPESAKLIEGAIPDGWIGVDIGPVTMEQYGKIIASAGMVVWNGPVGKFEDEPFSRGTRSIAEAMAGSTATTIVGGGETAEAVEDFGLQDKMSHVSTGGGAFLEYVEGTPFAALDQIESQ